MRFRLLLVVLLMMCAATGAEAQVTLLGSSSSASRERPKSKPKPKRHNYKDHARYGIKLSYNTDYPYFVESIGADYNEAGLAGVLSLCTFGPSMRLPIGNRFFFQTEMLFGINTPWQDAFLEETFLRRMSYGMRHRSNSFMWIPLYVGYRWAPYSLFAVRAYVGPRFDFMLTPGTISIQDDHYGLMAAVGLDLFKAFSLDVGFGTSMNGLALVDQSATWFLAVSLMF